MPDVKPKILIVDDMPVNIRMLGEVLHADYQILIATSGQKALQIAQSANQPDLILLDIMMPEIDGFEVCRRLKSDMNTQDIPIIFITAKNAVEDEIQGLELGAVDFITKPFSMPIVKARVKTHLMLKLKSDLLEKLTNTDALTNIPNRRKLDEFLHLEWNHARRNSSELSVIFTDIDYFKQYNDFYGHQAGDNCLITIARILRTSLDRSTDFVARYGGEEFVVVLPQTTMSAAQMIAKRIQKNLELANLPHQESILPHKKVSLSMGIASTIPKNNMQPEDLVKAADEALYQAKTKGRNQIVIAS